MKLDLKAKRLVEQVIAETRLTIVHSILQDMNDYDGRFDSPVQSLEEVIQIVMKVKVNEQFITDMANSVSVKK